METNVLNPAGVPERVWLVTGAAGHLGRTVLQELAAGGQTARDELRALVLPGDRAAGRLPEGVRIFWGDVTRPETLVPAFALQPGQKLTVVHAAGIITISSKPNPHIWQVNVGGTLNVVHACLAAGARLVHVSSVHALPEQPFGTTVTETDRFSPHWVHGLYAKTKAAATRLVLQAVRTRGLWACVVHPSGITGPGDCGHGHLTQMIQDYCNGALPAGVLGGYDFVDVRDVAAGCIAAGLRGRRGECYLLTNRYYTIPELLNLFAEVSGRRPVRTFLPLPVARAAAPLAEAWYRLKKQAPLFTLYSLYTLRTNAQFSHAKADRELGYTTRPMRETVADTIAWLRAEGRIRPSTARQRERARLSAVAKSLRRGTAR